MHQFLHQVLIMVLIQYFQLSHLLVVEGVALDVALLVEVKMEALVPEDRDWETDAPPPPTVNE